MDLDHGARFVMHLKHSQATVSRRGASALSACETGAEPVTGMLQKLGKNRAFPLRLILISGVWFLFTVAMPRGTSAEDAVIAGFHAGICIGCCNR
jgi:hypothetical protein